MASASSELTKGPRSSIFAECHHDDKDDQSYIALNEAGETEQAQTKTETPASIKRRVFYIDWMRIIAIYLVVSFHVVQALDDMVGLWPGAGRLGDPAEKVDRVAPTQERILVENFQSSSLMIGMPLFFHISGRAQGLGRPASSLGKMVLSRVTRLLLPFLVCYAVLIPPWMWISWPAAPEEAQANLFKFEYWYWTHFFFQPAWLWFLPVLFIVTVLSSPMIQYAELKKPVDAGISVVVMVACAAGCIYLKFTWYFALFAVLGQLVAVLTVTFFPFPPRTDDKVKLSEAKRYWFGMRIQTISAVVSSVGIACSFEYAALPKSGALDAVPALILFYGFYVQGFFCERWSQGCDDLFVADSKVAITREFNNEDEHDEIEAMQMKVRIYQVFASLFVLLTLAMSSPVGRRERMLYPVYSASFCPSFPEEECTEPYYSFALYHILGTWGYLGICICLGQAYLNHDINHWFYQHASGSTMVVYIFHWMFLKVVAVNLLRFNMRGSYFWRFVDIPLLFGSAVGGSLGIYALLLKIPCLGRVFGL